MRVLLIGLASAGAVLYGRIQGSDSPQDPPSPAASAAQEFFQRGNPGQARTWAGFRNKIALIAFYAKDCERCRELDDGALSDPELRAWLNERTIPVRLQNERDPFYAFWRVIAEPTLLFITPDGEELGRIEGAPAPEDLRKEAERILSQTDGLAAARARVEASPEDPWAHVILARALRNRHQAAQALNEFLWVLDHTRGKDDWRPQREGEVLREISVLSQRQSEATLALRARRDRQTALLLEPPAGGEEPLSDAERILAARDVRVMNSRLGQPLATLAAWDDLRAREGTPRALTDELFDAELAAQLLQAKRYADVVWAWPDLIVVVERRIAEVQALRDDAEQEGPDKAQATLEFNRLLGEASGYYEALLGVGREKDAADLAELLLALEPNARIYTSLMIGAQRADRLDNARAIYARGLAELEAPAQKQALERVGQSVLGQKP
jgi:hypothetical protein